MTVRWRILALQLVSLLFVLVMTVVMTLALNFADHFVQRVDAVHRRFEVIAEIDGLVSKYAGQVAEVLLLGRTQMGDLQTARVDMERAFARLTQVTRREIATLTNMEQIQNELPEIEETRRMIELYHAIDMAAAQALVLQRDGQTDAALTVFVRDVEFRLKTEFAALLNSGLQDERNEITDELANVQRTHNAVLIAAATTAALAVGAMLILGIILQRSIVRPVQNLTAGARAIADGNLDHRIEQTGTGEFATLSQSFNDMASSVQTHREDLVRAGEQLATEVEARTVQLREANDRLRDIDSRRAQFLADVSHELRTPLTILRGEADVALRGRNDPQEQRQSLERIQAEAIELGQLLDDLISFARSDAEPQTFVPTETRLDDILAAAVQEGETLAEPRELILNLNLTDNGVRVEADFRRLKQALIIGIDNAVKHSPPGGRIDIESALEGEQVVIRIMDEGPGIAEEDKARVFERFYRGRNGNEPISDGLGIGLAIARDILERHHGGVALENRPDGGAMLTISLPLLTGARA